MPYLTIRAVNSVFDVSDQGGEYVDTESAYRASVMAAIAMAQEEITGGANVAIVETCVEDSDGIQVARGVVSIATSRLQLPS